MKITVQMTYLDRSFSAVAVHVAIEARATFEAVFQWFDEFIQSLLPLLLARGSSSTPSHFYMPNEEECIVVTIGREELSVTRAGEEAINEYIRGLDGYAPELRPMPSELASRLEVYSSLTLASKAGILLLIRMIDRYIEDRRQYSNQEGNSSAGDFNEFAEDYPRLRGCLLEGVGDIEADHEIKIASRHYVSEQGTYRELS
jgi:hypothetical protein